jgi:predicted nucleotide-binding protein (sugar kinase/HSP70/actin superfamily)
MWVRFIANFDYRPSKVTTIAYKAEMVLNVPRSAGEAAIAAGKAVEMRKTHRDAEPEEVSNGGE